MQGRRPGSSEWRGSGVPAGDDYDDDDDDYDDDDDDDDDNDDHTHTGERVT